MMSAPITGGTIRRSRASAKAECMRAGRWIGPDSGKDYGPALKKWQAPMDIYDQEPWREMDLRDLTAALRSGDTIEDAAQHLCRSGTVDDVRRKAEELGLKYKSRGGR
jgi:hypothetical protein